MITINQCNIRIAEIKNFISIYEQYLESKDSKLRNEISRLNPSVSSHVREASIATVLNDPNVGPYDMFENILEPAHANPHRIIDRLYQALGAYEYQKKVIKRKIVNPLYWAGEFIRIPFHIMRHAGFNTSKIELSWFGKAYTTVSSFVVFIGAIIGILVALGVNTKIFSQDNASKSTQNIQAEENNSKQNKLNLQSRQLPKSQTTQQKEMK